MASEVQGSKVMRQSGYGPVGLSGRKPLATEEPDEGNPHVRICGGTGRAIAGSTRTQFECGMILAEGQGHRSLGHRPRDP